ncbi:MAG: hypothetical protein ACPG5B_11805 [Chitinophagales bacterium]
MRGNNLNKNTSKNHSKGEVVSEVLSFLKRALPFFIINQRTKEVILNNQISKLLNKRSRKEAYEKKEALNFLFTPEFKSNTKNSGIVDLDVTIMNIDISTQSEEDVNPFFTIECKRLRTPISKSEQYVSGKTGGIERFKANKHGIDLNGNLLKNNAMIGYVEDKDFKFWLATINKWIDELIEKGKDGLKWLADEKLKKESFDKIAVLKSKHLRSTKEIETVELTHFWIKMA